MKLKMNYAETKDGKKALVNVDFVAENEEEKSNLGWLRDYFFLGLTKNGTFPQYAGRKSDEEGTTEMIRLDIPYNARRLQNGELNIVENMEYTVNKYKSTDE